MTRAELELLRPVARLDGDHARDDRRAARRARRAALGLARQGCPRAGWRRSRLAGELRIPFTSGILIGIGETRAGAARRAARAPDARRRARPPPGGDRPELPRQAGHADGGAPEPSLDEHLWTIAAARILLGPDVARAGAAEPRLRRLPAPARRGHRRLGRRLAGDDRPRQPRGAVARASSGCARRARSRGLELAPRLPVYPRYVADLDAWLDPAVAPAVRARRRRARARPRGRAGRPASPARVPFVVARDALPLDYRRRAGRGRARAALPRARATSASACSPRPTRCAARSAATRSRYVVTRNIQYTNVCYFRCGFCAFSKGKLAANLRGAAVPRARSTRSCAARARPGSAARPRSASRAASTRRSRATTTPTSSSAIQAGACRGCTCTPSRRSRSGRAPRRSASRSRTYLARLRDARARLAPRHRRGDPRRRGARAHLPGQGDDRAVARGARRGAPGRPALERDDHVRPRRGAASTGRATCSARASSSARTGGFTEFVPLPFVHMEAPIYLAGPARVAGRPSARRCSCTPSRGSRCTRGSRTSRRRG